MHYTGFEPVDHNLNRTPIRYRVHSNVQALTPSNFVPRLSAREWCQSMHLPPGTLPTIVLTMDTKGIYDKRPTVVKLLWTFKGASFREVPSN